MKSRMEKYYDNNVDLQRSKRNNDLYGQSDNVSPSTSVNLLDNVSEIDMSKIKDLFNSREGYQSF